jgi:hypothetical protein
MYLRGAQHTSSRENGRCPASAWPPLVRSEPPSASNLRPLMYGLPHSRENCALRGMLRAIVRLCFRCPIEITMASPASGAGCKECGGLGPMFAQQLNKDKAETSHEGRTTGERCARVPSDWDHTQEWGHRASPVPLSMGNSLDMNAIAR